MGKKKKRAFVKRMLTIILSLCMLVGMIPKFTLTVEAHDNNGGYPYNVAAGIYIADEWGFFKCECTSFVAYCLNNRNGFYFHNFMYKNDSWGNANNWGTVARRHDVTVDNNPAIGAVAWSSSGHVAWVCAVNGDYVTIDEYNYGNNHQYNTRTVHKSNFQYIHLKDISPQQPEERGSRMETGGARTISDGDYHIVSALTGTMLDPGSSCLTIDGLPKCKNDNEANAGLWSVLGWKEHVFTVTWQNNGFYKIKLKDSDNKCLDVVGGDTLKGTNVQQYEDNGTDAQQWCINEADDGYGYTIQTRCSGYYLDVWEGKTTDATNIHVWEGNGTKAQKWYFVPWGGGDSASQEISNGEYEIVPKADENKALSVAKNGFNIELNTRRNDGKHTFQVTYLGNGYYKIINKNSNLSLDVADGKSSLGANVQLFRLTDNTNNAQKWIIKSCGNGYYNIISKLNGAYVDLLNENTKNETNIQMCVGWEIGGGNAQKWRFIPYDRTVDIIPSVPSAEPSKMPSVPSVEPSKIPSVPSAEPSKIPSVPSTEPSKMPSVPSTEPSKIPSVPSAEPSKMPSVPSVEPSKIPSVPSAEPSKVPSVPSAEPSKIPSVPSAEPSKIPSVPSVEPSKIPSVPSAEPSKIPSVPSTEPSPSGSNPSIYYSELPVPEITDVWNGNKMVNIEWSCSDTSDIDGYNIYRSKDGKNWNKIATINDTEIEDYEDKDVSNGDICRYIICSYVDDKESEESVPEYTYYLNKVNIKSVKSKAAKKLTVKWSKNEKASGYQIRISTTKSFTKTTTDVKKIDSKNKSTKTIGKLKSGKKYFVQTRAYRSYDGEIYYSEWSVSKSLKVKK